MHRQVYLPPSLDQGRREMGTLAEMAFMCKKDSEREQWKAGTDKGEGAQMSIAARSMTPKPAFSA